MDMGDVQVEQPGGGLKGGVVRPKYGAGHCTRIIMISCSENIDDREVTVTTSGDAKTCIMDDTGNG